jgi:hypothetical protein
MPSEVLAGDSVTLSEVSVVSVPLQHSTYTPATPFLYHYVRAALVVDRQGETQRHCHTPTRSASRLASILYEVHNGRCVPLHYTSPLLPAHPCQLGWQRSDESYCRKDTPAAWQQEFQTEAHKSRKQHQIKLFQTASEHSAKFTTCFLLQPFCLAIVV